MNITRKQAIKIIDQATNKSGYDDWWTDLMDDFGLYDEKTDTYPNLNDIFSALGVTEEELKEAL